MQTKIALFHLVLLLALLAMGTLDAKANGFDRGLCHNPTTGAVIRADGWGMCPRGWENV